MVAGFVRDNIRDGVILKSSGARCTGVCDVDGVRDDMRGRGVGDSRWGGGVEGTVAVETQAGVASGDVQVGKVWPKKAYKTSSTTTPASAEQMTNECQTRTSRTTKTNYKRILPKTPRHAGRNRLVVTAKLSLEFAEIKGCTTIAGCKKIKRLRGKRKKRGSISEHENCSCATQRVEEMVVKITPW
jgi:hypothetical protein